MSLRKREYIPDTYGKVDLHIVRRRGKWAWNLKHEGKQVARGAEFDYESCYTKALWAMEQNFISPKNHILHGPSLAQTAERGLKQRLRQAGFAEMTTSAAVPPVPQPFITVKRKFPATLSGVVGLLKKKKRKVLKSISRAQSPPKPPMV